MHNRFWGIAAASAALVLLFAADSRAINPVAFEFTAQVTSVTDMGDLPPNLNGSLISGRYTFDADTPAIPDQAGTGLYPGAMRHFAEVDLLGTVLRAVAPTPHPTPLIQVRTHDYDLNAVEDESYQAVMSELPMAVSDLILFEVFMTNPGPSPGINGTALAVTPPDPMDFASAQVAVELQSGSEVIANLQTLPEPGSAAAAVALALAFGSLGRRRRRARG